nr:MazG nucleotide pyrophosphohydrolase domain-containing protein [Thermococcus sp. Bubb.Bath]
MGGYWSPFQMLAALVEEVGELADAMLAFEGVKGRADKANLEEELGDALFALACIANFYGFDMEEALHKSVEKYRKRDLNKRFDVR